MVTQRGSTFKAGKARSAKTNGYSLVELSKVDVRDPRGLPTRNPAYPQARCRSPQPTLGPSEGSAEIPTELYVTLWIDKHGRCRIGGSACLQEHVDDIFPPELLDNLCKFASWQERKAGSAKGPSHEGEFLGSWQSIETRKARCMRLAEQSTRKRRLSPGGATTICSTQPRSNAQVQLQSQFPTAASNASEIESSDDDESVVVDNTAIEYKTLKIGDEGAVKNCYYENFDAIQQVPCKCIAKAWIKVVEPKKQANHPYNGGKTKQEAIAKYGKENQGYMTSPDWWPAQEECRHKEPDHIKKERFVLLDHILRKISVPCKALEDSTKDIESSMKRHLKKPIQSFLSELYFVRKKEEAYSRGEIDGETVISVRVHKKSNAGQSRKPPKKPANSTSAKAIPSLHRVPVPQPTSKTFSTPQNSPPLWPRSISHVKGQRREHDLAGCRPSALMTQNVDGAAIFDEEPSMYQASGGIPAQRGFFQESSAQGAPMHSEVPNHAASQALSFEDVPNGGCTSYAHQHPATTHSTVLSKPAQSTRRESMQQPPVFKPERPLPLSTSWPPRPSSPLTQTPLDNPIFFQQGVNDAPPPFEFLAGCPTQNSGLPFTPSQNPSFSEYGYGNCFGAAPSNHTYQPQTQPTYYDTSAADLDEKDYSGNYPGNYPYPSR